MKIFHHTLLRISTINTVGKYNNFMFTNIISKNFFSMLFIYKKIVFLHPQKITDYYPLG